MTKQEQLLKKQRLEKRRRAKRRRFIVRVVKKTVPFVCFFILLLGLPKIGFSVNAKETVLSDSEDYPADLVELYEKNPETLDFVLQYPKMKSNNKVSTELSISDCKTQNGIPLFLQWDSRWGYCSYGDKLIAQAGCGPTSLSMVAVALTGDATKNPGVVSRFSEDNGYLDGKNGTLWSLMTYGAKELGLSSEELPLDETIMIRKLQDGQPIICSMRPGDFTTEGHFIVLCGYENGSFIVNDPNSKQKSEMRWTYQRLEPQIKNLWAFS